MRELTQDVPGGLQRHRSPCLDPMGEAPWHTAARIVVIGPPDLCRDGPVLRDRRDIVPMISEHCLIGIEPRERFRIARQEQPLGLPLRVTHQHRPVPERCAVAARAGQ